MSVQFGKELKEGAFFLDKNSIFLNNGSYGAVPKVVYEKQCMLKKEMESHPDSWFRIRNPVLHRENLEVLCTLIGADYSNTVFAENATAGTNSVLHSFDWKRGDVILISNQTFHAVKVNCEAIRKKMGVVIKTVDVKFPLQSKEQLLQFYEEALKNEANIKLAIIDHITSTSAVLMPVKELAALFHRHNVPVLVDGAHALGQIQLNIPDLGVDFYAGNIHKWFFTPRGCAYLWVHPSYTANIKSPMVSHFHGDNLHYNFFVTGTRDDTSYCTMGDALKFYEGLGGRDAVYGYNTKLLNEAAADLIKHWGTGEFEVATSLKAPYMRLVRVPDLEHYPKTLTVSYKLQYDLFNLFNIQSFCTAIQGELYVRLSVQVYNCLSDYVQLRDAVLSLLNEPGKYTKKESNDFPAMHWNLTPINI